MDDKELRETLGELAWQALAPSDMLVILVGILKDYAPDAVREFGSLLIAIRDDPTLKRTQSFEDLTGRVLMVLGRSQEDRARILSISSAQGGAEVREEVDRLLQAARGAGKAPPSS